MTDSVASVSARAWPRRYPSGRTYQPVRAEGGRSHPYEAGEDFYRPTPKDECVRLMRALERLFFLTFDKRKRGERRGALTLRELEVMRYLLFRSMHWKTGRLEPTYQAICSALKISRQTVAEALKRLAALGVLQKMRRFFREEDENGEVSVRQAPNAYRVALPAALAALLTRGAPPPLPEDYDAARKAGQDRNALHEGEAIHQAGGRPGLAYFLARLGENVRKAEQA